MANVITDTGNRQYNQSGMARSITSQTLATNNNAYRRDFQDSGIKNNSSSFQQMIVETVPIDSNIKNIALDEFPTNKLLESISDAKGGNVENNLKIYWGRRKKSNTMDEPISTTGLRHRDIYEYGTTLATGPVTFGSKNELGGQLMWQNAYVTRGGKDSLKGLYDIWDSSSTGTITDTADIMISSCKKNADNPTIPGILGEMKETALFLHDNKLKLMIGFGREKKTTAGDVGIGFIDPLRRILEANSYKYKVSDEKCLIKVTDLTDETISDTEKKTFFYKYDYSNAGSNNQPMQCHMLWEMLTEYRAASVEMEFARFMGIDMLVFNQFMDRFVLVLDVSSSNIEGLTVPTAVTSGTLTSGDYYMVTDGVISGNKPGQVFQSAGTETATTTNAVVTVPFGVMLEEQNTSPQRTGSSGNRMFAWSTNLSKRGATILGERVMTNLGKERANHVSPNTPFDLNGNVSGMPIIEEMKNNTFSYMMSKTFGENLFASKIPNNGGYSYSEDVQKYTTKFMGQVATSIWYDKYSYGQTGYTGTVNSRTDYMAYTNTNPYAAEVASTMGGIFDRSINNICYLQMNAPGVRRLKVNSNDLTLYNNVVAWMDDLADMLSMGNWFGTDPTYTITLSRNRVRNFGLSQFANASMSMVNSSVQNPLGFRTGDIASRFSVEQVQMRDMTFNNYVYKSTTGVTLKIMEDKSLDFTTPDEFMYRPFQQASIHPRDIMFSFNPNDITIFQQAAWTDKMVPNLEPNHVKWQMSINGLIASRSVKVEEAQKQKIIYIPEVY